MSRVCVRARARPPCIHNMSGKRKWGRMDRRYGWTVSAHLSCMRFTNVICRPRVLGTTVLCDKNNAKRCKHVVCGETSQHQVHEATGFVTPAHVTLCPTFGPGMPVETLTCRQNCVSLTSCLSESDDCAAGVESFCSSDGVRHECVC